MTPFTHLESHALPLLRDNVDTDAIIPSREMKSVSKDGLADGLFAGWRYKAIDDRTPNPDFVLNDPKYLGAEIILGGANFGCGSSREHAVWALAEYGFRAVVADSFNPIFHGNCIRNGILPIQLPAKELAAASGPFAIDLEAQTITASNGKSWNFPIDPEARMMLLEGLDPIALTLKMREQIAAHAARDALTRPWISLK